jgi:hypothetical protein
MRSKPFRRPLPMPDVRRALVPNPPLFGTRTKIDRRQERFLSIVHSKRDVLSLVTTFLEAKQLKSIAQIYNSPSRTHPPEAVVLPRSRGMSGLVALTLSFALVRHHRHAFSFALTGSGRGGGGGSRMGSGVGRRVRGWVRRRVRGWVRRRVGSRVRGCGTDRFVS